MDELEKMIDNLVDNHYDSQHLIGTDADESEYLQDTYYSYNKTLKRELEKNERYIQHND
jgi:hypothetical protein